MPQAVIQSVQTLATKGGGIGVTLSFKVLADDDLIRLIRAQGQTVRISFEIMQQELGLGDDVNEGLPDGVVQVYQRGGSTPGDVVQAHAFLPSEENSNWCSLCQNGESNPVHSTAAIEAREARENAAARLIATAREDGPTSTETRRRGRPAKVGTNGATPPGDAE